LGRSLSPHTQRVSTGTRLPTFHARAADQAHVAYVPDTTWPVSGHPPGSSRDPLRRPGFDAPSISITTLQQRSHPRDCAPSSWSPPDASSAPFPRRSPRRSSTNAARGGLEPPPAGRLRRANLHLSHSTASRNLAYINQLLSAFVAQVGFVNSIFLPTMGLYRRRGFVRDYSDRADAFRLRGIGCT
jgi:hypothetical protein